jgi:hypothetical protein
LNRGPLFSAEKTDLAIFFFPFDSPIRSRRLLHTGCTGNQIWARATRLWVWVCSSLSLDRLHLFQCPPFQRASISAIPFVFRIWGFHFPKTVNSLSSHLPTTCIGSEVWLVMTDSCM